MKSVRVSIEHQTLCFGLGFFRQVGGRGFKEIRIEAVIRVLRRDRHAALRLGVHG